MQRINAFTFLKFLFIAVFLVVAKEVAEAAPPSVTTTKPPTHVDGGSAELVAVSREMEEKQKGVDAVDRSTVQTWTIDMTGLMNACPSVCSQAGVSVCRYTLTLNVPSDDVVYIFYENFPCSSFRRSG